MSLTVLKSVNNADHFIKRLGDYFTGRTPQPNLRVQRDDCRAYVARYLRDLSTPRAELLKGFIIVVGHAPNIPVHIVVADGNGNILADKADGHFDRNSGLYYTKSNEAEPLTPLTTVSVLSFFASVRMDLKRRPL